MNAEKKATVVARVQLSTDQSSQSVFNAWTTETFIRRWMPVALQAMGLSGKLTQIRAHPVVGGEFLFADLRNEGEARHFGHYLSIEPGQTLHFTWFTDEADMEQTSIVRIHFESNQTIEGGPLTQISLEHEMDADWADYIEQTEWGWKRLLEASAAVNFTQ